MWAHFVPGLLRQERLDLSSCRPNERVLEDSRVLLRQEVPLFLQRPIIR